MFIRAVILVLVSITVILHVSFMVVQMAPREYYRQFSHDDVRNAELSAEERWLLDMLLFIQRREHTNEMCSKYASLHRNVFDSTKDFDHILVDEKHQLLYCYVPKVACTNGKRVFMVLMDRASHENTSSISADLVHKKSTFPKLSDYSVEKAKYFIDTFTKYLFVRHPFERLLSAFRNKLERPLRGSKYFQQRIGREIIKHYRINASKMALENANDVTFEEFAAYLTDHYVPAFNEHWRPISELCYPCLIHYNFIGKYETLQSDAEFLLKALKRSEIKFPNVRKSNTTSQIVKYFNTLPPQTIARLYNIFILDFKLFGYSTENILGYEIG